MGIKNDGRKLWEILERIIDKIKSIKGSGLVLYRDLGLGKVYIQSTLGMCSMLLLGDNAPRKILK